MNTIKNLYQRYKNFIKYCVIGFSGAFLDFCLFALLTHFLIYYQYANAISVTFGITNNFFLNAYFNFKVKDRLFKRFISFYAVGMFGLLISAAMLFVLVETLHTNKIIAKILTIFVITIVQFSLNKIITFRVKRYEQA